MWLDTRARLERLSSTSAWDRRGRCIKSQSLATGLRGFTRIKNKIGNAQTTIRENPSQAAARSRIEMALGYRVCGYFCRDFSAARSAATASLFLGRSGILRSRRARPGAEREPDSTHHCFERASAAGAGLDCTVVEMRGLRAAGDAVGNAGGCGVFADGIISAG